jgi:hypothetical protein
MYEFPKDCALANRQRPAGFSQSAIQKIVRDRICSNNFFSHHGTASGTRHLDLGTPTLTRMCDKETPGKTVAL